MSTNENKDLQKRELIEKLEAISVLHSKALSIKSKMNNFVPEDNYQRKIIVPTFPGEYEDYEEREYWQESINHEDDDAVEQMSDFYDEQYHPKKPAEPKIQAFRKPDNSQSENKQRKWGCFSYIAVAISIFFVLGAFVGVDESTSDTLPTIFGIAIVAAISFVVFRLKIKSEKAAALKQESMALNEYNREVEQAKAKYNDALKVYESECISYKLRRQDFLDEYSDWREVYLESVEEEQEITEKLEADRVAVMKKIEEEELTPVLHDMAEINDLVTVEYLPAIDIIIDLLKSGRADGLKEAINLYEDIVYRERQLKLQREKEEQRRREEAQRRADEERRYQEEKQFREQQEYQRRYAEEQRQREEERRHREEMNLLKKQERDRQYEEKRRLDEQRRREDRAELARKQEEDRATQRQCNTCALTSRCSMAFRRPNCASYRPR